MDRRDFLGAASVAALAGTAGCLRSRGRGTDDYDVGMSTEAFDPATFETTVGSTVVWNNTSGTAHTVTAVEGAIPAAADYFASGGFEDEATARDSWADSGAGSIYAGEVYEHTFEVPGRYDYVCIPHESAGMVGTVRVSEE